MNLLIFLNLFVTCEISIKGVIVGADVNFGVGFSVGLRVGSGVGEILVTNGNTLADTEALILFSTSWLSSTVVKSPLVIAEDIKVVTDSVVIDLLIITYKILTPSASSWRWWRVVCWLIFVTDTASLFTSTAMPTVLLNPSMNPGVLAWTTPMPLIN